MPSWIDVGGSRPLFQAPFRAGSRWWKEGQLPPFRVEFVDDHLHQVDVQEALAQRVEECGPHRNHRMETFGVEGAKDFYLRTEGTELVEIGGPALPDVLGIDPVTKQLLIVEVKGTGNTAKRWADLGLINEKRIENSPEWLDRNSARLLECLQAQIDATPPEQRARLEEVKAAVETIVNEGGFEMNPEAYRNELYIAAREGAMDPNTSDGQRVLSKYVEATGCERVIIDEAPGWFVDQLLDGGG